MSAAEITIHLITSANASLLDRVDDDVFDNEVQSTLLAAFLANPANLLGVAVIDDEVKGYEVIGMASGIAYLHPDKPLQLFINEVGVSGRFQRQGLGKQLVRELLARGQELGCREAWVATEVSNTAARALYLASGGREDDDPAVVYTYALGPSAESAEH